MSAWSQLATTSIAPSQPASAEQRVWDNQCCEVQAIQLLDAASDHVERVRSLASRAPGSSDWLHTTVEHWAQNGQRYRPHCCWSATRCSNRATTRMCMRNCMLSQSIVIMAGTILSPRLRTTFTTQSIQRDIVSCI